MRIKESRGFERKITRKNMVLVALSFFYDYLKLQRYKIKYKLCMCLKI